MKKIRNAILILSTTVAFGCQKDGHKPNGLNGNYNGKLFSVYVKDYFHTGPITDTVSLSLEDGKFTANSKPLSGSYTTYFGTKDSGTFKMVKDTLSVSNEFVYPDLFDHDLTFIYDYHLTVKGDSVILTKTNRDGNSYTYRLKKSE